MEAEYLKREEEISNINSNLEEIENSLSALRNEIEKVDNYVKENLTKIKW